MTIKKSPLVASTTGPITNVEAIWPENIEVFITAHAFPSMTSGAPDHFLRNSSPLFYSVNNLYNALIQVFMIPHILE